MQVISILDKAMQLEAAEEFKYPIREDQVPGYSQQVRNPMDLSTVQRKVRERQYFGPHEAWSDIQLVSYCSLEGCTVR